jgi:hypothetical protein
MKNGGLSTEFGSVQPVVALPHPGLDSLYYLFTQSDTRLTFPSDSELRYSIIDLRHDKGLGAITVKEEFLYRTNGTLLTSVRHANGEDHWLLSAEANTGLFLAYLVDGNGLHLSPILSLLPFKFVHSHKLRASADGRYLVTNSLSEEPASLVQLLHFDNNTGKVVHSQVLPVKANGTAVEFSPNGRKIYFQQRLMGGSVQMVQVAIEGPYKSEKFSAPIEIASARGRTISDFRVAPDGKLYIALAGGVIDMIDNPNDEAVKLQYRQTAYYLDAFILPNNLAGYVLGKQTDFAAEPECDNKLVQFAPRVNYKCGSGSGTSATRLRARPIRRQSVIRPTASPLPAPTPYN